MIHASPNKKTSGRVHCLKFVTFANSTSLRSNCSVQAPGILMGFYGEELGVQERPAMFFILQDQ